MCTLAPPAHNHVDTWANDSTTLGGAKGATEFLGSCKIGLSAVVHFRKSLSEGAPHPHAWLAMPTSRVLLPDPVKNMDAFSGGNFAPSSCRNFITPNAAHTSNDVSTTRFGEVGCSPCTASQGSGGASLPYEYFGSNGYYSCQLSHTHWTGIGVKSSTHSPVSAASHYGDKYTDMSTTSTENYVASRAKEFAFYPSYGSSPYQPVAGYQDVPVVQGANGPLENKNESSLLPVESYHPWAISASSWNAQVCCDKEQLHTGSVWKASVSGKINFDLAHASDSKGMWRTKIIF